MAKKKAYKSPRTSKKPYNVDKGMTAHKRLLMKNRKIRKSTDDPYTYFNSLEKELYHDDCVSYLSQRGRKLSKAEKSEIFKNASHRARSKGY